MKFCWSDFKRKPFKYLFKKMLFAQKERKKFLTFQNLIENNRGFELNWKNRLLLDERTSNIKYDDHYVYHIGWAIRKLLETKPEKHTDISSYLYFNVMASAICPIDFYEYRPSEVKIPNLQCLKADIKELFFEDNSIKSLSCMHIIEHVGLGRYGDELDPQGDLKGIVELKRVLAPNGNLFFVVPVSGNPRIIYNAHRVYSFKQVNEFFKTLKLQEFTLITDNGEYIQNASENISDEQYFGCGCFWFKK